MKVTVMGSGVFGKAVGTLLASNGLDVAIWTHEKEIDNALLPSNMVITNDYKTALENTKMIFMLTSSPFIESVLKDMKKYYDGSAVLVIGSKGLSKNKLPIEIAKEVLNTNHIAVMSGPTFAIDVKNLEPIGFTIATFHKKDRELFKIVFKKTRLEFTDDLVGTELAGILKNIYAIGSGMLEGLSYGYSTKCLYITEVLKEMQDIIEKCGGDRKTAYSLAGVGDLFLTCTSLNSRNFVCGSLAALDKSKVDDYLKTNTVEGYDNLDVMRKILKEKSIDAPILDTIYRIIMEGEPSDSIVNTIL